MKENLASESTGDCEVYEAQREVPPAGIKKKIEIFKYNLAHNTVSRRNIFLNVLVGAETTAFCNFGKVFGS